MKLNFDLYKWEKWDSRMETQTSDAQSSDGAAITTTTEIQTRTDLKKEPDESKQEPREKASVDSLAASFQ